jgi:hypothetical protein
MRVPLRKDGKLVFPTPTDKVEMRSTIQRGTAMTRSRFQRARGIAHKQAVLAQRYLFILIKGSRLPMYERRR